jgi:hypothetical protein
LVGKYSFVAFSIKSILKEGDDLSPILLKFSLEYAFRMGHINRDGLKLICTHQLSVFVADVNIFEGKLLTVKKNTEAIVISRKENGIEVNAVNST